MGAPDLWEGAGPGIAIADDPHLLGAALRAPPSLPSHNLIEASWQALVDALDYKLYKDGKTADESACTPARAGEGP